MMSQKCVGKRIIWAFFMVVLCTFLTFFLSNFMEKSFGNIEVMHRVALPVLLFLLLGIVSFCLQNFFVPLVKNISIPLAVKIVIPCVIAIIGLCFGHFYYVSNINSVIQTGVYEYFSNAGNVYVESNFSIKGIYDGGLSLICMLLGYTVFSISIYQRIFVVISAILLYFAVKNFTKREVAADLFLALFLFGKPVLDFTVKPDATVIYMLLVSLFLLALSVVFMYRKRANTYIWQIISFIVLLALFALLVYLEQNSIILGFLIIAICFSGYNVLPKKVYWISSVVGDVLVYAIVGVYILLGEIVLSQFIFSPYFIDSITTMGTTLLVLNILGFVGIYGIWHQKLYYIFPFVVAIYYFGFGTSYISGVSNEFVLFLCFVFYAVLGLGMLEAMPMADIDETKEIDTEKVEETVLVEENLPDKESVVEETITKEEQENLEEIKVIKEMNEKLNEAELEFIPMTFKRPKRTQKKAQDYAYEPTEEEMKFDIEVLEDDDFDV